RYCKCAALRRNGARRRGGLPRDASAPLRVPRPLVQDQCDNRSLGQLCRGAGRPDADAFSFNCDIATPMVCQENSVFAVDMWIDVLVRADGLTCCVGDEDEFADAIARGRL